MAKLSLLPPDQLGVLARQMADSGIAVTVLPATDLFLMGRDREHAVVRGVADANVLCEHGVNCSLSSNNILNPATPYGDCSLIRMANLYANVLQVDAPSRLRDCFDMLTTRSARLMNLTDYGFAVGNPADVVIIDARCARAGGRRDRAPARGVQERQAHGRVGEAATVEAALVRRCAGLVPAIPIRNTPCHLRRTPGPATARRDRGLPCPSSQKSSSRWSRSSMSISSCSKCFSGPRRARARRSA